MVKLLRTQKEEIELEVRLNLNYHQKRCHDYWKQLDRAMQGEYGKVRQSYVKEIISLANYHAKIVREYVAGTHDRCFPSVFLAALVIDSLGSLCEGDRYLVLYEKDGLTHLLQSDMTGVRAVNSCRIVNDHEERNGRPRKFYVARLAR